MAASTSVAPRAIPPPWSFHQAFRAASCSCSSRSYVAMWFPGFCDERSSSLLDDSGYACGCDPYLGVRRTQRFHADFTSSQFFGADDDSKARPARVGFLHLCLDVAASGVHEHHETGIAQALGEAQRLRSGPVTDVDNICVRWASRSDELVFFHQQHDALHAHGKAAGRRDLAAQLLDQPVVAPSAGYRSLRSQASRDPLEHRAVVVIEAAHQARIDHEAYAGRVEQCLQHCEVFTSSIVEIAGEFRRGFYQMLETGILAVERAQRIGVQAAAGVFVQLIQVRFEVLHQIDSVPRPRFGVAYGVDMQFHVGDAELLPQTGEHDDLLGIDIRPGETHSLDVDLMELPISSLLWPLITEHWAAGPNFLGPLVEQTMLDCRTYDAGSRFRAQCEAVAVAVGEGVHLLLDDVGDLADGAAEQLSRLDHGQAHIPIAVAGEQTGDCAIEKNPKFRLLRQDIVHPADGLNILVHDASWRQRQPPSKDLVSCPDGNGLVVAVCFAIAALALLCRRGEPCTCRAVTRVGGSHVIVHQTLEVFGDRLALESHCLDAIHVHRRDRALTGPGKADADIGVLALAGPVDDAAHDRDVHVFDSAIALAPLRHLLAQEALDLFGQLLEIGAGGAAATRASDHHRRERAQAHGLEQLLSDGDLAGPVSAGLRSERDANRVADALLQQDPERGGGSHDAFCSHPRLGKPEVQRIVAAARKLPVH